MYSWVSWDHRMIGIAKKTTEPDGFGGICGTPSGGFQFQPLFTPPVGLPGTEPNRRKRVAG